MLQAIEEKQTNYPQPQVDIDGYHPKATQFLIKLFSKPVKMIEPPSQDIDEMLDWLEK